MSKVIYNLFLISMVKNGKLERPLQSFIENDYTTAKLHFHGWVECDLNKAGNFVLHKIGEFDMNERKFKSCMIYICDKFQAKMTYEDSLLSKDQLTLKITQEYNRAKAAWEKNIKYNDKIKAVFEGRYIDEQKTYKISKNDSKMDVFTT